MQTQIAERLIGLLADRVAQKIAASYLDRFFGFSIEKELADFREMIMRASPIVIVREPFPQRVFVKLDAFVRDSAKNHRAHDAVSDRKRVGPFFRRVGIP